MGAWELIGGENSVSSIIIYATKPHLEGSHIVIQLTWGREKLTPGQAGTGSHERAQKSLWRHWSDSHMEL